MPYKNVCWVFGGLLSLFVIFSHFMFMYDHVFMPHADGGGWAVGEGWVEGGGF